MLAIGMSVGEHISFRATRSLALGLLRVKRARVRMQKLIT